MNAGGDLNPYSADEARLMRFARRARAVALAPVLRAMAAAGLCPGHLTVGGLALGLAFCPVFVFWSRPAAFVLLLLHLCADALDGPLARYRNMASRRGAFTDTVADQTVVAATTATFIYAGVMSALPGVCYVFLYTVVVGFAMVRNYLNIPYHWLVRPRLLVYGWAAVEVYLLPGTLDYVLWLLVALLGVKMVTGFVTIRRRL